MATEPADLPAERSTDSPAEPAESAAARHVRRLVDQHLGTVVLAVKVLRVPAILVGLPAIPALLAFTVLAATASGWWRLGLLVASAVGWTAVALWWIRIKRYSDAVRDPDRLRGQLIQAFALIDDGEILPRLLAVFEAGGLRLFYRLRAVWRVVRIPDYLTSEIEDLDAARWFIPPMPATTVLRLTILIWTTAVSWAGLLILIGLRIGGVV
ncbi:hypothetical protein [Ruania zhangjianzhongii]|uniref:hypothetical protein n=1 Tax=Ruania zhangjianzhongii TaxID=2603206 RepID=UPI0011CA95AA|nr:hypothetical protein [Ruania zhangjianzhongii]